MPNKNIQDADFYRRENQIIDAKDGGVIDHASTNVAKKKSKELQEQGYKVVVLNPKRTIKGRY